jgi:hypothetical protein
MGANFEAEDKLGNELDTVPSIEQSLNLYIHRKHGPFFVPRKTITKTSKYVHYVIKFVDATNPIHILSLSGPHNRNWQG